jgi:hypothetical protein
MHLVAFIHHSRNLGSETDRGTFQQTAGKAYGPGIYPFLDLLFAGRRRRIQCPAGLRGTHIAERGRSDKHSHQSCKKMHFKTPLLREHMRAWR